MQDNNCATIRRSISRWAISRLGVMTSISSMKTRQPRELGPLHRAVASANSSRMLPSESPDRELTSAGADT